MRQSPPDADLIDLLLVEDREADIELVRRGFCEIGAAINLHVVRDGIDAIAFLRHTPPYERAPRPRLIVLDLKLPRMDGRELLAVIKNDPQLKSVPVVILTTSAADSDVSQAYALHANAYMLKPVDYDRLVGVIRAIADYWFAAVKLPPRP
jgi:CheY-like chemotaxis protein